MYKEVLLAIDLEEPSSWHKALPAAVEMCRATGARLHALTVVPELGPDERDLVMTRLHGMSAVHDSGIDPVLRTLGIQTVVVVGVSLNVGIPNSVMDLANRGYDVVVPTDAVAGTPASYQDWIMNHTIKYLARVAPAEEILAAWSDR